MDNTSLNNNSKTKLVVYNVENRILEKDGLQVQFFDKIKQMTDNFLQTIDVVDEKSKKPVYNLYVEIYNLQDPYNIVFREVEIVEKSGKKEIVNNILKYAGQGNQTYAFQTNYTQIYKKAFANYQAMQQNQEKPYPTFTEQMKKGYLGYLEDNGNTNSNELV